LNDKDARQSAFTGSDSLRLAVNAALKLQIPIVALSTGQYIRCNA
jgi:hypothetical protein